MTVIWSLPIARPTPFNVNTAEPAAESLADPSVVLPEANVTVPIGIVLPETAVTVAVRTVDPVWDIPGELAVTVVLVATGVGVTVTIAAPPDPLKSPVAA